MPLPAAPAVFRGVSCHRLPLEVPLPFLAPVACPAPAVELCLLGLRCLGLGSWFSTLCRALFPGPAVWCRLPFGAYAFSDTVYLAYCCAGGVGWAATLPLCSRCFSCAGWLAGVHWVLHPVSGSSHGGCDCFLGGSVVVPFGSPFLSLCYLFCHLLLRLSTSVGAVLCSLLVFPCLRVGTLLACGVYGASSLRSLQSRLPFVFGPPSPSVCPSAALAVGWFGHRSVAPPAAPVCWAIVGSLLRRSVALGSCAPYPVGSSLADSYGFVVHALGVFLDSFLRFFPLTSSCYGWLGVVVASTSCGVPCLWLALCSSACVSPGGCPSFSQVGPAHSHWLPLLWTWCACGLQLFTSPM